MPLLTIQRNDPDRCRRQPAAAPPSIRTSQPNEPPPLPPSLAGGAALAVTLTLRLLLPPLPVQLRV